MDKIVTSNKSDGGIWATEPPCPGRNNTQVLPLSKLHSSDLTKLFCDMRQVLSNSYG